MEREQALELLNDAHNFPGPFLFRAVVGAGHRATVVSALSAIAGLEVVGVDERLSRNGNWTSVHTRVQAESAEVVLDAFAILHALDEVKMVL
jgi:putative lipoic acid-binding regulatory protein